MKQINLQVWGDWDIVKKKKKKREQSAVQCITAP